MHQKKQYYKVYFGTKYIAIQKYDYYLQNNTYNLHLFVHG